MSDRRGVGDKDVDDPGRDIQTRGSSACSSLNRCEPGLPNSIPARGVIEGHAQRPDTRPIENPAETSKITLAKQAASHVWIRPVWRGLRPSVWPVIELFHVSGL